MWRNPRAIILLFFVAIHFGALLAYGWDKARARKGQRRIPEGILFAWAFFGGLGALAGIFRLRHKNRKTSFLLVALPLIALGLFAQGWLAFRLLKG